MPDELLRDLRKIAHPHEEDERIDARRELFPIEAGAFLRRILMPRDDGKRHGDAPMRDGDARIGGHGNSRSHARHNRKSEAVFLKQESLLSAAAENKGIAALETRDALALKSQLHEQLADILLPHRVVARALADVDSFRLLRHKVENTAVREIIIDDDVRLEKALQRLESQKPRITRARSDQIYHGVLLILQ